MCVRINNDDFETFTLLVVSVVCQISPRGVLRSVFVVLVGVSFLHNNNDNNSDNNNDLTPTKRARQDKNLPSQKQEG